MEFEPRMDHFRTSGKASRCRGFLTRLARDRAGNTFAIIAASAAPLLALIGGGIDLGRGYLSQSRLQQACDAGVLAARKKLGSAAVVEGNVPTAVNDVGQRFFDLNFRDGAYGTEDRNFEMALESDYSISGTATVKVPTTIMAIFGNREMDIAVDCVAKLNYSNTDIMMVLDTTGSMNQTITGDTLSKINTLKSVVKNFHAQLEGNKAAGTRLRYGFVPYSTNVNVGYLLKSDWMVDKWSYNGRNAIPFGMKTQTRYVETKTTVSGSYSEIAAYDDASCPVSDATITVLSSSTADDGTQTGQTKVNGTAYFCSYNPTTGVVSVSGTSYSDYVYDWTRTPSGTESVDKYWWQYKAIKVDVSPFKGATGDDVMAGGSIHLPLGVSPSLFPDLVELKFSGCIEERDTYEITDYDNVDLDRAMDLDIDRVPDPTDEATQWRPMLHWLSYVRELNEYASGTYRTNTVVTSNELFNAYDNIYGNNYSQCPSRAAKLAEMDTAGVSSYVDSLVAAGNTYHDIGMIWGGRLLSPTGIFAGENADINGQATSRHLVFLTDGETAPNQISYATYGIEPIDRRRWNQSSSLTLPQTVEKRFSFACEEVKKKNITVWVIGFGTNVTDMLKTCAGNGHWFQADDSSELQDAFTSIAKSMGDLRITK